MACEQEDLKLDEHFKEILLRIEPHFLALRSSQEKRLCKLWLDKLCALTDQKRMRNFYIYQLHQQLRNNKLTGVFNKKPPIGPLMCQRRAYMSSSMSDLSNESTICERHLKRRNKFLPRQTDCSDYSSDSTSRNIKFQDESSENESNKSFVQKLTSTLRHLEMQNKELKDKFQEHLNICTADKSGDDLSENGNNKGDNNMSMLKHCSSQFNEELNKLNIVFKEEQNKNVLLNEEITSVVEKLDEKIKFDEIEYKEKLYNMYQNFEALLLEKNVDLKKKDELILSLEEKIAWKESSQEEEIKTLKQTISDLEIKLLSKCKDEQKLQSLLSKQFVNMKKEFRNIRSDIKLNSNKYYDNLRRKVSILKKTIQKLEKSREQVYLEYERKISRILMEQNLEKKALELQFKAQQSEMSASLNLDKQNAVNNIANTLEEKCEEFLKNIKVGGRNKRNCFSISKSESYRSFLEKESIRNC